MASISGPLYKSSSIEGSKVSISFDHVASGFMAGHKELLDPVVPSKEPLQLFQICGADREWKWAEARISGKDTIVVSLPDVIEPVEVRYVWSAYREEANLYNMEGLPASLFTTE